MTVGWYVHHHGAGHASRFAAVAPHLEGVVALSSLPAELVGVATADGADALHGTVRLPLDTTDAPRDPTAHGALHWVPLGHDGLRERMAAISAWIAAARPDAFVVDVSVEVAALARLHGIPTVLVAQRGRRLDPPHRFAATSATAIAAPWTAATHLPGDGLPDDRITFTGALSRFDGRAPAPSPARPAVLVLVGSGGHALDPARVAAAARATPEWEWHAAGALRVGDPVRDHGADADVWDLLQRATVVVGTAGGNVVAEVAAARRPFVCLPQDRPFAEQHRQGEALRRAGLADVHARWPAAEAWPAVLAAARTRDPQRWAALHDGHGAQRLAALVDAVAGATGRGARRRAAVAHA